MNKDIKKSINISGPVLTFVASDKLHSYNSQSAFFDIAFTAKKSYFISSPCISISNLGLETFSINSNFQSVNFLYIL
jgi:hypothetical protein